MKKIQQIEQIIALLQGTVDSYKQKQIDATQVRRDYKAVINVMVQMETSVDLEEEGIIKQADFIQIFHPSPTSRFIILQSATLNEPNTENIVVFEDAFGSLSVSYESKEKAIQIIKDCYEDEKQR